MTAKKVEFFNTQGLRLSGRIDMPSTGKPLAYAVFAHCFTCSKNLTSIRMIANECTQEGIAVLSFDFSGLGESEGQLDNFSSNIQDLISACEFLQNEYQAPEVLIGHSLGGAAVLQAAREIASIKTVVSIGAPAEPAHVKKHFQAKEAEIQEKGVAEVEIVGRRFRIDRKFLEDLDANAMDEKVRSMKKALLVMHAPLDAVVGIDNASKIFIAAKHPKSFVSLDGADHFLSSRKDASYAGSVIASWVKKYLDLEQRKPLQTSQQVVVSSRGEDGFYTTVQAAGHSLIADEPEKYGGTNLGPGPYDYLLTALGACTSMTIQMYARRKKWHIEDVRIHLSHDKVYSQDCADCETSGTKVDRIIRQIELIGDLSEEQRTRLLEIADKCPVHKTLHSEIQIESSLQ
ncbi:MAG: alpha/beta fold hydrolase [Spirochaetota bacterium]